MRKLPALLITAGLMAVSLTACTPSGTTACESPVAEGGSSALVKVSGKEGSKPTVSFPTPLKSSETERTVVREGSGAGTVSGQMVELDWSIYNGTTGELIGQTGYDGSGEVTMALADGQFIEGFLQGMLCATEGSRTTLVVPPAEAWGEGGNPQIGLMPTDSIVFVVDVNKAFLPKANGTPKAAVDGMPAVVLDENGVPGITVPSSTPPSDLEVAVLKQGDGETVKEGDQVVVHYTGVVWDSKQREPFDSTWLKEPVPMPAQFVAASGSAAGANGVIKGFADALIGQQVGSQIIAVIPPELAYGDQGNAVIPPNSTLVFVVDILGIAE